jgi:secondary thiamine-phosphate synthase enzyme
MSGWKNWPHIVQTIAIATGESNGDAHLKSLLIHHEVIVSVTKWRLDVGPWQQIYYAEFDGQRRKRVIIKVIGE